MSGQNPEQFNPSAFKNNLEQQWQLAAEAWYRWTPAINEWLRPATDAMLELAAIAPGHRVLDVAAGAGEPAATIAKRVGTNGSVLATDISSSVLEFAQRRAREAGVSNVETKVMDGETLALPDDSFDAAVSRLGVIWFPNRVGALGEMRRVLKRNGRAATVGMTNPMANAFSAITMRIVAQRAALPPPRPGSPGPFSLGTEAVMREAFAGAGFGDIQVRIIDATLKLPSARECMRMQREAFGGMDQLLGKLSPADRNAAWDEVATELRSLEKGSSFESPTQFIVGAGTKI